MENIKAKIFNKANNISGITISKTVLNIIYLGTDKIDYTIKLIPIQNYLATKNVNMSTAEIAQELKDKIESRKFIVTATNYSININLVKKFIETKITKLLRLDNIIKQTNKPQQILVDFSSPNIAKDLHVGHLRSTIIGDSICKLFELQGHKVHRINHIGDYGLGIAMVLAYLLLEHPDYQDDYIQIGDLQIFYAQSKKLFDTNDDFKKLVNQTLNKLQSGDTIVTQAWKFMVNVSKQCYDEIYTRLNVKLSEVGESFYQDKIPNLVKELQDKKLLDDFSKTADKEKASSKNIITDKGKLKCINLDNYSVPLTVVKSDGTYTYDTTDLSALKYRLLDLNMDKIYYVVDNGQSLHFNQIFEVAQKLNWLKPHHEVKHVGFGVVLGEDKKKFKSRNGNTLKLIDLLNESLQHAEEVLKQKEKTNDIKYTSEYRSKIIKNIAYGSLKYADLSITRTNDYIFSFSKMLQLNGNTGVYQLYVYVRICSVMEKAQDYINRAISNINNFKTTTPDEQNICKILLQFPEILERVNTDLMLHLICTYLYNTSTIFNKFFKNCRCIHYYDDNKTIKDVDLNRLLICMATKKVLYKCFEILGIEPLEKM